jgi:hypothetical protein
VKLVFLDTETTSLRHDRRAWDVALIVRESNEDGTVTDTEHQWFVAEADLDLANADPKSLEIGGYYDRHPAASNLRPFTLNGTAFEKEVMWHVEQLTRGAVIVGAVPNFDTEVLGNRMRDNHICPSWHYHLVDVETLAAGWFKLPPKWNFDEVLRLYGLEYDEADRHTAMGDARMVRDVYDAIMGPRKWDVGSAAKRAYNAYGEKAGWLNHAGNPMPNWDGLGDSIRDSWRAAAEELNQPF